MSSHWDKRAEIISNAMMLCDRCGVARMDHAANGCADFQEYDGLAALSATPAEAAKINPMGASNECITCGGDVRGCMC